MEPRMSIRATHLPVSEGKGYLTDNACGQLWCRQTLDAPFGSGLFADDARVEPFPPVCSRIQATVAVVALFGSMPALVQFCGNPAK